jgi:hypothetical protein
LAKKRKAERRVASVDAMGILMRDLKKAALWVVVSVGAVSLLAVAWRWLSA